MGQPPGGGLHMLGGHRPVFLDGGAGQGVVSQSVDLARHALRGLEHLTAAAA